MAYIILQSRRTRQPQNIARVNWSSPLARGLCGAWLSSAGNLLANAVLGSGVGDFTAVGGPAITPTPYGLGFNLNGSSQYLTNTANAAVTNVPCTFVIFVYPRASTSRVFDITTGTTADDVIGLQIGSSSEFVAQHYDGSTNLVASTATFPASTWYALAGRFNGLSLREIYVNGSYVANNIAAAATPSGINRVTVGYAPWSNAEYLNGIVALPLLWNRALSAPEIAEISRNPWQIFAQDRRIYFAPSGGGATIITTSGAASLVARAAVAVAATKTATAASRATIASTTSTTSIRTSALVAKANSAGTAATTTIRTATIAARTAGTGTAATTTLRTGLAAGRLVSSSTTTYAAIIAGAFAAAGRTTARGTAAYTSTHAATAAATTTTRGAASATTLRDGIAAARLDARAAVTAAALVAGTVTTSAAAQIGARASISNTTERSAALAAMLALRGANPAAPELPVIVPPSTRLLFPDHARLGLSPVAPSKPRLG